MRIPHDFLDSTWNVNIFHKISMYYIHMWIHWRETPTPGGILRMHQTRWFERSWLSKNMTASSVFC